MRIDKNLFKYTEKKVIDSEREEIEIRLNQDYNRISSILLSTPNTKSSKKDFQSELRDSKILLQKYLIELNTIKLPGKRNIVHQRRMIRSVETLLKIVDEKITIKPAGDKEKRLNAIQQFILCDYLCIETLPKITGMRFEKRALLLSNLFDKTPRTIEDLLRKKAKSKVKIEKQYERKDIVKVNGLLARVGLPLIKLAENSDNSI